MTRAELIDAIAKGAKVSKTQADKALAAFTDTVTKSLRRGEKVTLVGFGSFSVVRRKARKGRNPRTGEPIQIKAAKVPKFSPGRELRKEVNR